ncbi:MAG: HAMP domain-containing histidine kinase, partial [Flavobacteriaceae bacterium]|nr:HAMP domain-containing histidine kinase [Flavobacteriaceae bacterium]
VGLDATNTAILEFISNSENPVTELSSKIVVSIAEDRLRLGVIDSLFAQELARKNLSIDFGLSHEQPQLETEYLRPDVIERATLETKSQSPYFFYNNHVKAHFTNVTFAILKKNLLGILLSFLLVTAVILCLLYLLKIINHQKQLAEVKNDLISNITHEFKTPIATIGVAMEAIENFNKEMDHEKNLRYAKISREQVGKLNVMVEKLLETATLDSEKLQLNLETKDLVELLREVTQKESIALGNKRIEFHNSEEECYCELDVFHFENAINNIIDNAIKYGGDKISVFLQKNQKEVEIRIEDSGISLTEGQAHQLFEKFYRVPRGNTHDVKGFGIGLYYSRKIVEKHNGKISVSIRPNTAFKITLPHG